MTRENLSGTRLPHIDDLPTRAATQIIARALADVYREALNEPMPERLVAILRQMENERSGHGHDAA